MTYFGDLKYVGCLVFTKRDLRCVGSSKLVCTTNLFAKLLGLNPFHYIVSL